MHRRDDAWRLRRARIDWVPETERHGRIWHQAPLWFLGNFQYFSIPIGFVGPALGLSLGWTILAGVLGIVTGTIFMAFHAAQGPTLGLPQMIQSRAQFGYRGVIVPLFATAFTYLAFNVADQVLLAEGLNGTFGWNKDVVAIVCCVGAALLAIYGHDWVHRIFRILLYISFPLMLVVTRRDPLRRRRRRESERRRVRLGRVHGPVLRGRRLQHHLRALRQRLLALPAARRRPTARSSPASSSGRAAPRSG